MWAPTAQEGICREMAANASRWAATAPTAPARAIASPRLIMGDCRRLTWTAAFAQIVESVALFLASSLLCRRSRASFRKTVAGRAMTAHFHTEAEMASQEVRRTADVTCWALLDSQRKHEAGSGCWGSLRACRALPSRGRSALWGRARARPCAKISGANQSAPPNPRKHHHWRVVPHGK